MRCTSVGNKSEYGFCDGLRDSVPIGLGYLSVSFGFGVSAVASGIPALVAVLISLTNLTSAGQVAGVAVMAAGGGLLEMALTQLTINLRYSLMSISLTQRLDSTMNTLRRAVVGFGVTDEIFAVAVSKPGVVGPKYTDLSASPTSAGHSGRCSARWRAIFCPRRSKMRSE